MTELDRLLDFAARSRVPGGFGYLGDDGRVVPDRPLETWIVARMTHVFGLAHLLGRPGADELVRHGVRALTDGPLHDAEHGGWRASTDDDTKAAYVHAFVVLAGSTATAAGVAGGPGAARARRSTCGRPGSGTTTPAWWSRSGTGRGAGSTTTAGVNANMHGVEASLAAADALARTDPAVADRLRAQALRTTERVVHGWARQRDWRLPEHFTAAWEPLPDYNRDRPADPFRPVRRHRRAPVRVGPAGPAPAGGHAPTRRPGCSTTPVALFDAAAERGWAADGHDGFPYTLGLGRPPRRRAPACTGCSARRSRRRPCWPRSPASSATGDLAARWRGHGELLFADPTTGSWHHELTPAGEVGSGTWTGQPDAYHLAQMLLLDGRPVRGSVAAALR